MKFRALLPFVILVSYTQITLASDLGTATKKMCNHMKVCFKENMMKESEDVVTPQMQQMLESMVDNMCVEIFDQTMLTTYPEVEDSAIACMNSITQLGCSAFEDDFETPECKTLEKLGEKYGFDQ